MTAFPQVWCLSSVCISAHTRAHKGCSADTVILCNQDSQPGMYPFELPGNQDKIHARRTNEQEFLILCFNFLPHLLHLGRLTGAAYRANVREMRPRESAALSFLVNQEWPEVTPPSKVPPSETLLHPPGQSGELPQISLGSSDLVLHGKEEFKPWSPPKSSVCVRALNF